MTDASTARRSPHATRRVGRDGARRPGRAAALPPEQRRAAIVAAATPLLRARGLEVTTREIADAAGIAEGTIFRVFATKRALIDAVVDATLDVRRTVDQIRAIDPAACLEDRVRACAEILSERLSAVFDTMMALRRYSPPEHDGDRPGTAEATRRAKERQRRHRQRQNEVLVAITDVLEPDAGRLAYPPKRAAHLLRILTFAGTHRMISEDNTLAPAEIAEVLLHGIAQPANHERGSPAASSP